MLYIITFVFWLAEKQRKLWALGLLVSFRFASPNLSKRNIGFMRIVLHKTYEYNQKSPSKYALVITYDGS